MAKILVITDSLGLPRDKPQICLYEETWPKLIRDLGHVVHQVSIGGATISELYNQGHYHKMFLPDIVVIQSGIVDCAPRALTKFENSLLNHYRLSRYLLKIMLPKFNKILRNYRDISYTSETEYEENIIRFKEMFPTIPLIWIGIVPPTLGYEEKLPGITKRIDKYNNILKKNLDQCFIQVEGIENKGLMSDHIHLNGDGHQLIFKKLKEIISDRA